MADTDFPLEHVHVPPEGGDADTEAPGVLLLHGRGADEEDLLGVGRQFGDAHVLSARAPDPLGPGYTWYELDLSGGDLHQSQPDADDFDRSRDRLDEFAATATATYGVTDLGILGFSQGAILGMGSLLDRPDVYRWVAALHGYLPARYHEGEYADAAGRPALVAGGEVDEIIPVERSERAADRLEELGLDVTYRAFPTGHGIGSEELEVTTDWVDDRLDGAE